MPKLDPARLAAIQGGISSSSSGGSSVVERHSESGDDGEEGRMSELGLESRPTLTHRHRAISKPSFRSSIVLNNIEEITGPPVQAPPPPRRLSVAERVAKLQNKASPVKPPPAAAIKRPPAEPETAPQSSRPMPTPAAAESSAVNNHDEELSSSAHAASELDDAIPSTPPHAPTPTPTPTPTPKPTPPPPPAMAVHAPTIAPPAPPPPLPPPPRRASVAPPGEGQPPATPAPTPTPPLTPAPPAPQQQKQKQQQQPQTVAAMADAEEGAASAPPLLAPAAAAGPPEAPQPQPQPRASPSPLPQPSQSPGPEPDLEALARRVSQHLEAERSRAEEGLLSTISATLKSWAADIAAAARQAAALSDQGGADGVSAPLRQALQESSSRSLKVSESVEALHESQLRALRECLAEERAQALRARAVFEDSLRTKYDAMVASLHDRLADEHIRRVDRALDDLQRQAKAEADRARHALDSHSSSDSATAQRFQQLVAELRSPWMEEELARAKASEASLRAHYGALLEHMESQLKMTAAVQDAADHQWQVDVERRNKQQVETLRSFENRCHRLYSGRMDDFALRTGEQLRAREEEVLELRRKAASHEERMRSRLRRTLLACHRWRSEYQSGVEREYLDVVAQLQARFEQQAGEYARQIDAAKADLAQQAGEYARQIDAAKADLAQALAAVAELESAKEAQPSETAKLNTAALKQLWERQGLSQAEQVAKLVALLDAAEPSPELSARFLEEQQAILGAM